MSDLTFDVERYKDKLFDEVEEDNSYLVDITLQHLINEQERRKNGCKEEPEHFVWTTRDGRNILVKDMTDKHLANTINFVKSYMEHMDELMDEF